MVFTGVGAGAATGVGLVLVVVVVGFAGSAFGFCCGVGALAGFHILVFKSSRKFGMPRAGTIRRKRNSDSYR
jgi:zinc transporter ZupT